MKSKISNLTQLNVIGNQNCPSDQEILRAILRGYRKKLSYFSIFAAVPAFLTSQAAGARSYEARSPQPSFIAEDARPREKVNASCSSPALLKRQSQFILPHQKSNFAMLATVGGNDDCPGRSIPGGNYTAASPFVDSGDTTLANDTITTFGGYYCYYFYAANGPDHIYSFTLTGRGPNPKIEISRTSGSYQPLVYVLDSAGCQSGIGNFACVFASSGSDPNVGIATIDSNQMNFLPLNVPLHLFIDGSIRDARGSGPYTIRMQDVTVGPTTCPSLNRIDCAESFVWQHYLDFLTRPPDAAGLAFWTNEITSCGSDAQCLEVKRINVSAAFFLSIENQEAGYLTHRAYKAAYSNLPGKPVPLTLSEFEVGQSQIGNGVQVRVGDWQQRLEANKVTFFNDFVNTARFRSAYPQGMANETFVDALNQNTGNALSQNERDALIVGLNTGALTRAQALRAVAEDPDFAQGPEKNRAFVLAQYFGYLRRDPDAPDFRGQTDPNFLGYNFWLSKLEQFGGNFVQAEMVKAFLDSIEYRRRFGPP